MEERAKEQLFARAHACVRASMSACHALCALIVVALALATLALLPPTNETLVALVAVVLALARAVAVAAWRRSLASSYGASLSFIVAATLYVDAGTRLPTLYATLFAAVVAQSAVHVRYCDGPRLLWRHFRPSAGNDDPPASHSKYAVVIDE